MAWHAAKHRDRDERLPACRDELLRAALGDLTNDRNVLAVYLGGSLAVGDCDAYSDIDLRIVVPDAKFEEAVREKQSRPRRWGGVLYFEDHDPEAPWTVVHYDSFVKADIFYYRPDMLQPSIRLRDIRIVHDPQAIIGPLREASRNKSYRPAAAEAERWRGKLFAYVHETYRRVMRGELYYAMRMLDMVRWQVAAGWAMEAGRMPNSPGDWSKIEGEWSALAAWQRSLLASWDCGRDPNGLMGTLCGMLPELKRVHGAVCRIAGIDPDEERLYRVLAMVV